MKDDIYERAVDEAIFIIENQSTVRATAKKFGISKSAVHKDFTERLLEFNPVLHNEVRKILDLNTDERAARGGRATQLMHKRKRVTSSEPPTPLKGSGFLANDNIMKCAGWKEQNGRRDIRLIVYGYLQHG